MTRTLFIGCFPYRFNERDVLETFEPYGTVKSVDLHQDKENATFDAYAYVRVETEDLEFLLRELDGKAVDNRVLRVNEAVARKDALNLVRCHHEE